MYLHGGGYVGGRRDREALAAPARRAGRACVSADYRLRPEAGFAEHLADAKKGVAWKREHGAAHGADPRRRAAAPRGPRRPRHGGAGGGGA
ncbi:alpha/beta hydrolase, partial [Thermobifida halotolerans]|uniref:alpha/beta hydrolase n=1 Tax=Thermobifida halotolerans TaxID=483545 RepID=UPI001F35A87E